MGSYSITCGMSKLSINENDNVVFFPLFKDTYSVVEELHFSPTLCDNDGSMTMFSLFSLPIFGKYNDQGGIYHIEKDANTDIIEEYLKVQNIESVSSIEAFTEMVCDLYERVDVKNFPITGMFVLREVYDNIIKDVKTNYGKAFTREEESVNYDNIINKFSKDPEKYIYETYIRSSGFSFGSRNGDCVFSYEMYSSQLSNPVIKEKFIDLLMFNQMMYYTNSLFMPQLSGVQCGHYSAQQQLAKITLDITNRKLIEKNQ